MLAKKYEEKYKQVAEIASKLTIEEAKFRELQVMTIYNLYESYGDSSDCINLFEMFSLIVCGHCSPCL